MGSSEKFCLQWDSKWDTFAGIRNFSQFFDCTLITDDGEASSDDLRAHKLILSACSEFFSHILTKESVGVHPNPVIYIRGISTWDMSNILDFIYNGEITMDRAEVDHFLEVAESLKIKGLVKGPIGTLVKHTEKTSIKALCPSTSMKRKESEESLMTESS